MQNKFTLSNFPMQAESLVIICYNRNMKLSSVITSLFMTCGILCAADNLADKLWFYADFDSPVQIAGASFQKSMPTNWVVKGKFGNGYNFTGSPKGIPKIAFNGDDVRNGNCFNTSDKKIISSFPFEEGTFACWLLCDTNFPASHNTPLFSLSGWWKANWLLERSRYSTSNVRGGIAGAGRGKALFQRTNTWMHVALTWNRERTSFYVNGQCVVTNNPVDLQHITNATLRIGSSVQASGGSEAILDDVAIFGTTLTEDEIKAIVTSDKPLCGSMLRVGNVDFTVFFRNQTNAALRTTVFAPEAGKYKVSAKIAEKTVTPFELDLPKGESRIAIKFDPSRFRPGKYGWNFSLSNNDSESVTREGELEIRGRLDRDAFRFNSWGPHTATLDQARDMGINQYQVGATDMVSIRSYIENGFFVNLRLENSWLWRKYDCNWPLIKEQVAKSLEFAEGLHSWKYTLINSEVYGDGAIRGLTNNATFLSTAEKELGFKPVIAVTGKEPTLLQMGKIGKQPLRGIIDPAEPAYATMNWFNKGGHPTLRLNGVNREAIRSVSPDNIVWSEPSYGTLAANIDMLADWQYRYSETETLWEYRNNYAGIRPYGKGYQPTLTAEYCHGSPGNGYYPDRKDKDGKPVPCGVTQSADEAAIKTMCALGSVRVDSLCWWHAQAWSTAEKSAADYLSGGTNNFNRIADPGTIKKYGDYIRSTFFPAADLLRGMDTVRAPVALVTPYSTWIAGGFGWGHWHYHVDWKSALAKGSLPFDILGDKEITPEILSKYKIVFLPMANVIEKQHDEALKAAAANGTRIVLDGHTAVHYQNDTTLTNVVWNSYKRKDMLKHVKEFCQNEYPSMIPLLSASSTGDGETAFTFEKDYNGVRYVMTVNDNRKPNNPADGLHTRFLTNETYRPYGASQRITTTIRNVSKGSVIYEFNARQRQESLNSAKPSIAENGTSYIIDAEYAPAETRIFVILSEPVLAPKLAIIKGTSEVSTLQVRIKTKSGKPAPGRTVIQLTVTDPDGRITDETGRYTVENGSIDIPVRFADCDPKGGFISKWKATVTDLVTDETTSVRFTR